MSGASQQSCRTVARDDQNPAKGERPPLRPHTLPTSAPADAQVWCALVQRRVTLHFKKADGEIVTVEANEGDDIVDVSWEYDLDIEG